MYVVRKHQPTDFKALKKWKGRSGKKGKKVNVYVRESSKVYS